MKKFLAICTTVLFIATVCNAQSKKESWMPLGMSEDSSRYYGDSLSFHTKEDANGIKRVWIKVTQKEYSLGETTYYNVYLKHFYEINCKKKEMRLLRFENYTSDGEMFISNDLKDDFYIPEQGSIGEFLLIKSCNPIAK